jgi:2-keto-3-deoxy-L-rhamnonate aldolase RhmA
MSYKLKSNPIKKAINDGHLVYGLYICVPSPTILELAANAGLDFVRIDCYHSALDLAATEHMIRTAEACGIVPFVRVNCDPQRILSVLEMGAMGIIVPDVSSKKIAAEAVNAVRFHPLGNRGMFSATRISGYGAIGGAEYAKWSNEQVMLSIQVESAEGVMAIDEILEIPGIDMVQSGRGDLATSLGFPGQKNHPSVIEAEKKIFSAAKRKGLSFSLNLEPTAQNFAEEVQEWKQKGVLCITLGTDIGIIRKAFENTFQNANKVK